MSLIPSKHSRIWGAKRAYRLSPMGQLYQWTSLLGSVFQAKIEGVPTLVVFDPEWLKALETSEALSTSAPSLEARPTQVIPQNFYDTLHQQLTHDWIKSLKTYSAVSTAQWIEQGDSQVIDLRASLSSITRWSLSYLLFGIDTKRNTRGDADALKNALILLESHRNVAPPRLPQFGYKHRRILHQYTSHISEYARDPWLSHPIDTLTRLCITSEWSEDLTETLLWVIKFLSMDDNKWLIEIQKEVDQLPPELPSQEFLQHSPLLHCALLETLRLAPPRWVIRAQQGPKCPIETISPKTQILYSPYFIHRDPTLWANPEQFDPNRFFTQIYHNDVFPWFFRPFGFENKYIIDDVRGQLLLTSAAAILSTILRRVSISITSDDRHIECAQRLRLKGQCHVTISLRDALTFVPPTRV